MVMLANATAAANAVIQSIALRRGDLLMMTSLTYPAVSSYLGISIFCDWCKTPVTVLVEGSRVTAFVKSRRSNFILSGKSS